MFLPYLSLAVFWVSTLFLTFSIYLVLHPNRYTGVFIQSRNGGNDLQYHFGEEYTIHCQERSIPIGEWAPSIYKISQMKPWTHIFCLSAFLASGLFRTLAALSIGFKKLEKSSTNPDHILIAAVYVVNEALLSSMLFGILYILLKQDNVTSFPFMLGLVYICFFVKMCCSLWHTGYKFLTVLRLGFLTIAAVPAASNWINFGSYLNERSCDLFTTPSRALCEWIGVFALVCPDVFDLFQIVSILMKKKKSTAKTLYMEIMDRKSAKAPPGHHVITVNE